MTQVRLAPLTDYTACQSALEAACGDLSWVTPGMKIAVKVNLVSGAPPEKAITTHPLLVAALTKLLIARGAEVVVGDSPGGLFTPAFLQRVYHLSGYEAVKEAGATLNLDCATVDTDFPQGAVLHQFTYTKWLTDCDAIINFCKLKTHGMMGMTAAVKNLFGAIPGAMKPEYHFRFPNAADFAKMLTDLSCFFRPRLHLVDAVVAMEGNGPTSGKPPAAGTPPGKRGSLRPGRGLRPSPRLHGGAHPGGRPGSWQGAGIHHHRRRPGGVSPGGLCAAASGEHPLSLGAARQGWRAFGARSGGIPCTPPHAHRGNLRGLRQVRVHLPGQGHHHGTGKAQNPPQDLHPLLLLPGILPQGRIESPAHQVGAIFKPVGAAISRPRVDRRSTPTGCTAIFHRACRGGLYIRPCSCDF